MSKVLRNTEIVVAVSENNVIGKENQLIWHIKEDLKLFKSITEHNNIVMGRKTFESLPFVLPNRHHFILTKNKDYKINDNRVTVFYDKNELIDYIEKSNEKFYIVGGGQIYNIFLPIVNAINLSRVHQILEGDTFFPVLNNDFILNYEHKYKEFTYKHYKRSY